MVVVVVLRWLVRLVYVYVSDWVVCEWLAYIVR